MNVGIIGAGHIGKTMARLLVAAGHRVIISNSRGPETLHSLIEELGPEARAATPANAAHVGTVVLLAIPFREYTSLPAAELRGKIAIDAMNYYPERDGHYAELDSDETTSSEMVAAHLPGTRIVKAFNTIWFEHLRTEGKRGAPLKERRAIFVSADDAEARRVVSELIDSIGFGAVDIGSLRNGRRQQPGSAIYNRDITVEEAAKMTDDR